MHLNYRLFLCAPALLFVLLSESKAQEPIGYYFDISGFNIEKYYDQLSYLPRERLNVTHYADSFEKGICFKRNGSEEGLFKFQHDKVWFKKETDNKAVKILPNDLEGLKIGLDSFFVAKNFNVEKKIGAILKTNPEFLQYLKKVGDVSFAKHINVQAFNTGGELTETYYIQTKADQNWVSFPRTKRRFKPVAKKYFDYIPNIEY